jgi:mono/diheme cytochrome c family protein
MRHFLANIITYTIAVLLFVGAAAFAWMRSSQLELTTEAVALARYEPPDTPGFHWQELGRRGYERNCANCHRSDGSGWDQYPPVTTAGALAREPGGVDYLIDLHLYGLTSHRWGAPMPSMAHIRDVELAAVINYIVTELGGGDRAVLESPAEVAARRERGVSPRSVNERRPTLP